MKTPSTRPGWRAAVVVVVLVCSAGSLWAQDRCTFDPTVSGDALVQRAWTCREVRAWNDALVARGTEVGPLILAFARGTPEARRWALSLFEEMGVAGDAAYAALGAELVDWQLEDGSGHYSDRDYRRLKPLGSAVTRALLARLETLCATGRTRVLEAIAGAGIVAAAPGLEAVALGNQPGCDATTRAWASGVLFQLDRPRGIAVKVRLLSDPTMVDERGSIALELARFGGPAGVPAAIEFLKDPTTRRGDRWVVAAALRETGLPEAVAAANRYQPSGRSGTGNPESSFGAWLSVCIWSACLLLVGFGPRAERMTRRQRIGYVAVAVAGAHVLVPAVFTVVNVVLSFYAPPLVVMIAIAAGMAIPLRLGLGAVRQIWGLTSVSAWAVAVGAVAGLFLGGYVDDHVYWYVARKDTSLLWVRYLSHLQQAVAWALPLAGTYLPHHSVRSAGRTAD